MHRPKTLTLDHPCQQIVLKVVAWQCQKVRELPDDTPLPQQWAEYPQLCLREKDMELAALRQDHAATTEAGRRFCREFLVACKARGWAAAQQQTSGGGEA